MFASILRVVFTMDVLGWAIALCSTVALLASWLRRKPARSARQQVDVSAFRPARHDPLTKLSGRDTFITELGAALKAGTPSALLLIDIDDFSGLNDRYGHRVGDDVLTEVAQRLRSLAPAALSGRMGADRFALLTPLTGDLAGVESAALSILRGLLTPIPCSAGTLDCTVSMGVALLPQQADDTDAALRAAGEALDLVRASGGAAWRFFDPEAEDSSRQREALAAELHAGLQSGQVVPYYQPIIDLADGRLVGLEVLARWQHPTRGLLLPDLFIPLAEQAKLTGLITETLMRRVVADSRNWPNWLYFAFNVAPGQLRDLIGMIRNPPAWPEGVLDPERLEVEVTESALIEDIEVAREVIALLQMRGTRVVLDDFGIGFSNFFHLRELPFDRIKIDRSFVMDLASDPRAEACVRAMLALGSSLGVQMVAEGISDPDMEARLAGLGCRFGQGYHYSEPVPHGKVAGLLRQFAGREKARVLEACS